MVKSTLIFAPPLGFGNCTFEVEYEKVLVWQPARCARNGSGFGSYSHGVPVAFLLG
jgi:hypothetical protein